MVGDSIERLSALFERFPGIGPRQAQRFVQFLLRSSPTLRRELSELVRNLAQSVHQCSSCMRFHTAEGNMCSVCSNQKRDKSLLAVVSTDADLAALERSGTYRGLYFVIGGTISLASEKANGLRVKELVASIAARVKNNLEEIILAFPVNPEGNFTALYVRDALTPAAKESGFKITMLGRGLSTGSELEYADPDTLKSALENRR